MLALAHPLSSLLCPCSGPGPAASSGLFLRPLPTSPLPVIPVKPSRLLQGHTHTHTQPMPQFQGETFLWPTQHQELDCFQMTLAPFRLHRRLQTSSLAFIPSARSRVSDYPLAPLLPSASLMSSSAFVVNSYAIRTFPSD
ncbi:uncharacterized protein CLUP02_07676 [Colletotrichum lupini]|uniref:Uncharacterized protein n=1 Tax=Colletotrichum lupini TaxID=145971 RepID=A0A9Q8SRF9_9PEZI|nr:uncharacterized protein CLUP02_07676 [Colletotrichum lupini]UQC82189.1 hypothetical protein CLUP02_07676 [Colletotrichum lupini]